MRTSLFLTCLLMLMTTQPLSAPAAGQRAAAEHSMPQEDHMAWWREARFGMFIHWGVYAVPAGRWEGQARPNIGEWIMENARIPVSQYEPLAERFNPTEYDPAEWAKIAREAGMKYIVITSKHHDGFALWDSKLSDWDVMRTPMKQDLLAPLAEASREEGLRFGLYHSIMDWHHPDYTPRRAWHDTAAGEPDFDRFRQYLHGQVQEIIENYQPDILWFDGEWESTWTHEHGKALEQHVRDLKPGIVINNRVGKARSGMAGLDRPDMEKLGDFGTPEQEIPSTGLPGVDWESCMTMNDTWGYKVDDVNWKSTRTLIRNLIECASKGGNYLLNVGPTAEGRIPDASIERLRGIGRWMDVNGEAIYGTQAGPFKRLPWGRATRKGQVIFLHIYDWPANHVLDVPLTRGVQKAWLLADPQRALSVSTSAGGTSVKLPPVMPDEDATVIALQISGEPQVIPVPNASQRDGGVIELLAGDADLNGGVHLEQFEGRHSVGYWVNRDATVSWEVRVNQPGAFNVELEFACEPVSAGSRIALVGGAQPLEWEVPATGGWRDFVTTNIGTIRLDEPGLLTLGVEARTKPGLGVMNLRRIVLTPAN